MDALTTPDTYGTLIDSATLKFQRTLPGPVENIWAYLTESELRRQWLAAGQMTMKPGSSFELVWRNDELTDPPGQRPPGFSDEHRMASRIVEIEAPHKLVFTWGDSGDVTVELEPQGEQVQLTLTHRGLPDREAVLMIAAGWHGHLDLLSDRVTGKASMPFWDSWSRLQEEYNQIFPG